MDRNVIQSPELLRQLAQRLGLRECHVSPTLNEGVQAVVVLDDVSRTFGQLKGMNYLRTVTATAWAIAGAAAASDSWAQLRNISTTQVIRVLGLEVRTLDAVPYRVRLGMRGTVATGVAGTIQSGTGSMAWNHGVFKPGAAGASSPEAIAMGMGYTGSGTQLVPGSVAMDYYLTAAQPIRIGREAGLVIEPGGGFVVQTMGANAAASLNAVWMLEIDEYS
jgi:hypothetical protein